MLELSFVSVGDVFVWVVFDVMVCFGNAMYVDCIEFEVMVGVSM